MNLAQKKIILIGQIQDLLNRLSEQQSRPGVIHLNSNFRIGRKDGIVSQVFGFGFSVLDQVYLMDGQCARERPDLYYYNLADLYVEDLAKIVDALMAGFYTFI